MSEFTIKGRSGYVLRPSANNPRVKRWQRVGEPRAPRPRGRASVNLDRALSTYGWVSLAEEQEFKDRFGPSLGDGYLRNLEKALNGETVGWHENDYWGQTWGGKPERPIDRSAVFGTLEGVGEGVLDALKVAHPDQYAARVLGTALPFFALAADPARSRIAFEHDKYMLQATMDLRDSANELLLFHRRSFNSEEGGLWDLIEGRAATPPSFNVVHNELLQLPERLQGHGLANPMYAAQTAYAHDLGASAIELYANLSVGGYNWPLLGYDFRDRKGREFIRSSLQYRLSALHEDEDLLSAEELDEHMSSADNLERAWDFARFTLPPHVGKDSDYDPEWRKVGKKVMLNSSFYARRDLDDDEAFWAMDRTVRRRLKEAGL